MNRYLCSEEREFVLSKQVLRSGTAIGALIHEAEFGQSIPDFRTKFTIALKEANETHYWLNCYPTQITSMTELSQACHPIAWN